MAEVDRRGFLGLGLMAGAALMLPAPAESAYNSAIKAEFLPQFVIRAYTRPVTIWLPTIELELFDNQLQVLALVRSAQIEQAMLEDVFAAG